MIAGNITDTDKAFVRFEDISETVLQKDSQNYYDVVLRFKITKQTRTKEILPLFTQIFADIIMAYKQSKTVLVLLDVLDVKVWKLPPNLINDLWKKMFLYLSIEPYTPIIFINKDKLVVRIVQIIATFYSYRSYIHFVPSEKEALALAKNINTRKSLT